MAEIKINLVYLTKSLTNLSEILVHLIQESYISEDERESILNGQTSLEKNTRLFLLIQIDWMNKRDTFLEILIKTGNDHCAKKIVCLTENLIRLSDILEHLIQESLITTNQRHYIQNGKTPFDCNGRLLDLIQKDWRNKRNKFLEILRRTGNGHCAEAIDDSGIFENDADGANIGKTPKKEEEKDLEKEENNNLLKVNERYRERNEATFPDDTKIAKTLKQGKEKDLPNEIPGPSSKRRRDPGNPNKENKRRQEGFEEKTRKDLHDEITKLMEMPRNPPRIGNRTAGIPNKVVNIKSKRVTAKKAIAVMTVILIIIIGIVGLVIWIPKGGDDDPCKENLGELLKTKKRDKAVKCARKIHEETNADTSLYNLGICLEYNGDFAEATSILEELFDKQMSDGKNPENSTEVLVVNAAKVEMEILKEIFRSTALEDLEPLLLKDNPSETEIRLFLLKLYFRQRKQEEALKTVKETTSVNKVLETLFFYENVSIPSYLLTVTGEEIELVWREDEYEIQIENFSLDLSILPRSIQKLYLWAGTEITTTRIIYLPNLRHLQLVDLPSSSLLYFRSVSLSHLDLYQMTTLSVDLIPKTVTNVKIRNRYVNSTTVFGGVKQLKQLALDLFSWSEIEQLLRNFQANQLTFSNYGNPYTPSQVLKVMEKEIKKVAVGKVDWGSEDFENSDLYEHLEGKSEYYILEGGKGRGIGKEEFEELWDNWYL